MLSVLLITAWVAWRAGIGTVHLASEERVSWGWPGVRAGPSQAYLLSMPLGPMLYRAIGHRSDAVYVGIHAVTLAVTALLLFGWLHRRLRGERAAVACCVILLAPLTAVELQWIGIYDAFSLLTMLGMVVALRHRAGWQFAAAAAAGFQDFEQVAVSIVLLWLISPLVERAGWRPRIVPLLAGAATGKLAIMAVLHFAHASGGSRLTYFEAHSADIVDSAGPAAPLILYSALAGLWGFAAIGVWRGWPDWSRATRLRLAAGTGLWLATAVVTFDHTRVLALVSFPLLVAAAVVIAREWPTFRLLWRLPAWWLLVIAPPIVVWVSSVNPMFRLPMISPL